MKVSTPGVLEQLIRNTQYRSGQAVRETAGGPDPFPVLLEEAVKREAGQAADIADREKLAALLELCRIRMSQSVMNVFSDSEEDTSPGGFAFLPAIPGMPVPRQGESKVKRPEGSAGSRMVDGRLDAIVSRASRVYGVDRDLICSVIKAESGFDPSATSPKGAMGLMQLMPETARELGVTDAYDPEQNVMGGTRHLRWLLDRYDGDVEKALAAYNWGTGNLERGTGKLPEETRNYIARIIRDYGRTRG